MKTLLTSLVCALAACGSAAPSQDDASTEPPDAGVQPDAMTQPAATPSREIVSGAGHVTGATYRFDIEIGQPISAQPASGATYTLAGNPAVAP